MKTIYQHTYVDRTPFTYYLKWSKTGISYFGCRYGKNCHPDQLGRSYLSSSTYVVDYIKEHGLPDIIKVTKIFDSAADCRSWENRFLTKTHARKNQKLLNRASPNAYGTAIYKSSKPPVNSGVKRVIKKLEEKLLEIPFLNLNPKQKEGLRNRCWINYKHLLYMWFASNEDRNDFLSNNQTWVSGRSSEEANIKISKAHKGKKKPPRTDGHSKKIGMANKGVKKSGSGPRKPVDYYDKIDEKKKTAYEKKLLRHKIVLYFLDMCCRVSTHNPKFEEYIFQGWSVCKQKEDYEYIKNNRAAYLSELYTGKSRPKTMTTNMKQNFSDGAKRGHITRKENALKMIGLVVL